MTKQKSVSSVAGNKLVTESIAIAAECLAIPVTTSGVVVTVHVHRAGVLAGAEELSSQRSHKADR